MSDVTNLANPDTTSVDLSQNVTGSIDTSWHKNVSSNHYAWVYVVGGISLLWLIGATFKA